MTPLKLLYCKDLLAEICTSSCDMFVCHCVCVKLWWNAKCLHEVSLSQHYHWQHSSECSNIASRWRLIKRILLSRCLCGLWLYAIIHLFLCVRL